MKSKTLRTTTAFLLGLSVFAAGCAQETPSAPAESTPEPQQTEAAEASGVFTPGTYESTVSSVGGPLSVAVTVSENAIDQVEVKEIHDTEGIYNVAAERIPAMIVENQSINVDNVSGATLSSIFIKNAIKGALSQAGDISGFQEKVTYAAPAQKDMETEVVIVGAGMAGLSAALTEAALGHSVVLLEELAYVGGNAIPSDQYSVNTEDIWANTLDEFNENGMNIEFRDFFGGAMQRMFPAGTYDTSVMNELCQRLKTNAEKKGAIILTETPAVDLIIEDGVIKGVVAKPLNQDEFKITAKATLLTNGGFQGNKAMVDQYLPYASGAMTIGPSKGRGEVYTWLEGMNPGTRDMDWELAMFYSINPTTGHHSVWGVYNINFIDKNGDLITEVHDYNYGSMMTYEAIGNESYYTVWSQTDVDNANDDPAIIDEFLLSGTLTKYESLDALAEGSGLANIKETLLSQGYAEDDIFYIAPAKAGIYGTMGGIEVDDLFRVVTVDGTVIPGLFAAGETIGRNYGGSLGGATVSGKDAAHAIDTVLTQNKQ